MDDHVAADPTELRALAGSARNASAEVAAVRARASRIMAALDRRGWNSASADDAWRSAHAGMASLVERLDAHATDLDSRARLLDESQNGQSASGLVFGVDEPAGGPSDILVQLSGQVPEEVLAQVQAAVATVWPTLQQVGGSVEEFVQGFMAEFEYVNNWSVPSEVRDLVAPQPGESEAMLLGRVVADGAALLQSGGQIIQGGSDIGAGWAACLDTGLGCVAVPATTAVGATLVADGAGVGVQAAEEWNRNLSAWQSTITDGGGPPPPDRTQPTGKPGDRPTGKPTPLDPNDNDPANIQAFQRENESAATLAKQGYQVEQNPPPKSDGKEPDYVIEGSYWDCYAPTSARPRNIAQQIQERKVDSMQADRIVLNLDSTPTVSVEDMRQQLTNYPIPGLREVIALKGGEVTHIFP